MIKKRKEKKRYEKKGKGRKEERTEKIRKE